METINEHIFKSYHIDFSELKFIDLLKQYPSDFDVNNVRNELVVICADDKKKTFAFF